MGDNTKIPMYKGFVDTRKKYTVPASPQVQTVSQFFTKPVLKTNSEISEMKKESFNEICRYIMDMLKAGKDEDELNKIAKNFDVISKVFVDEFTYDEGRISIYSKPDKDGIMDVNIYDKDGKLLGTDKGYEWDGDFYRYSKDTNGRIVLTQYDNDKEGHEYYKDQYIFENMEDLKKGKVSKNIELKNGFVADYANYEYRNDGTRKSKLFVDYERVEPAGGSLRLYDSRGNDSIRWDFRNSGKKIDEIKVATSDSTYYLYKFDENGRIDNVSGGIIESGRFEGIHPVSDLVYYYDNNGNIVLDDEKTYDQKIGDGIQTTGDCYFHAQINAIRRLKNGKEILNNLVRIAPYEEKATVTLPGVNKVYEFANIELKCLKDLCKVRFFQDGDLDLALLEVAFALHRTGKNNLWEIAENLKNVLDGSPISKEEVFDAIIPRAHYKMYKSNSIYGEPIESWDKYRNNLLPKDCSVYSKNYFWYETKVNKLVEPLTILKNRNKDNYYAATCSFEFKDRDNSHEVAITKVTDEQVTVLDSNDNQEITMSIDFFAEHCTQLTLIKAPAVVHKNDTYENLYKNYKDFLLIRRSSDIPIPEEYKKQIK